MTTVTFLADANDGELESDSSVYATARSGTGASFQTGTGNGLVGQLATGGLFGCFEGFLSFDTSSIPDDATITNVVLSLSGQSPAGDTSTTDFIVEARQDSWTAPLDTTDWVPGASLGGLSLLATFDTTPGWAAAYNALIENGTAFRSAINKTGFTSIVINSSRHRIGNQPTGGEYISYLSSASASPPKLVVTYTVPATGGGGTALGAKTNYAERKHLEHELGIAAWTMPTAVYLAFFTADPTEDGLLTNEVTGGGYARTAVTFGASGSGAQVGNGYTMLNTAAVNFPVSTGAWSGGVNITHAALMDAPTGNNMLRKVAFSTPFTVTAAGVARSYAIGTISVQEF